MGESSVIQDEVNLNAGPYGYQNSNQGHSAQFYNNYFERKEYWEILLEKFELK